MARTPTIKITGLDELMKQVDGLADEIMTDMDEAADSATRVVHYLISGETPEDTGELAETIKRYNARRWKQTKYRTSGAVTLSGYVAHVELGHKIKRDGKTIATVPQTPFMRPAADRSKRDVRKIIKDAMNETLKKYGGE